MRRVSAVIPAYNEAPRIAHVLRTLVSHPDIREVIVVDDGSTDATTVIAKKHGARVVRSGRNRGKGEAMQKGVEAARGDIIFFCDADIFGLTENVVRETVAPVLAGERDMFVAARREKERRVGPFSYSPLLDGQRALTRHAWENVPEGYKRGFAVESALNHYVTNSGYRLYDITQKKKEEKLGYFAGKLARYAMYREILVTKLRLTYENNSR